MEEKCHGLQDMAMMRHERAAAPEERVLVKKAELHCHIEGAVPPSLAEDQAKQYGVDIGSMIDGTRYVWSDFTTFLGVYDRVAALFRTRADYARLSHAYLSALNAQGAIYCEFFISTDHAARTGLDPAEYIAGLGDGIVRAQAETGIEARMIATGLLHEGPDAVMRAARFIVDNPHPLVTGWGMAGDERMHHPRDFVGAFDLARDSGLAITVHAGELAGAQSVADALDWLHPVRIGHGVRAIEDSGVVARLARDGIVLECCPGSNIALGVYDSFEAHPFVALRQAGVPVTLNSDDPPHFATSIAREYEIAATRFGLDDAALGAVTRTAIDAAFVDEATRACLLAKL